MKVALVCIARNEDRYINEWIEYHLRLGFDHIFVYVDLWKFDSVWDNVTVIQVSRLKYSYPQIPVYNEALKTLYPEYDWVAIFDVDEFLVLKIHNNIKEFLADKTCSVGINWVLFGDNGLKDDGTCGVLRRFTRRGIKPNIHVKCVVKNEPGVYMQTPHNPSTWIGSDGEMHDQATCPDGQIDVAQLNHYFCKTLDEWKTKQSRGCADSQCIRPDSDFDRHNLNEIEDLSAVKWFYE